jgi:hypothetical protein
MVAARTPLNGFIAITPEAKKEHRKVQNKGQAERCRHLSRFKKRIPIVFQAHFLRKSKNIEKQEADHRKYNSERQAHIQVIPR